MARVASVICTTMLCLATMINFMAPVSAQILPEVILECDDDIEIGFNRKGIINCVAENPTMYSETIKISVESGQLENDWGYCCGSFEVAAGSSTDFQVSLERDGAEPPGEILVNITACVNQINGVGSPTEQCLTGSIVGFDEEETTVTIIEYLYCEAEIGQEEGAFDSGDEISISAAIFCASNKQGEITYQIHLIEENMGSSSWPSGFQNIDGDCDVDINRNTQDTCNFRIGTPSNLEKDWEGCAVIIEKGEVRPNSCPSTNKIELSIKKKAVGLGIELGGNESLIEQLGITEEQLPVIGGSIGIVLLIIVGLMYYRRKGQEYE